MDRGYEAIVCAAWLTGKLTGDSALATLCGVTTADMPLRVFDTTAPLGTPEPYLIFNEQAAGQDTQGVNATIILNQPLYLVRAVMSRSSLLPLVLIAGRIHALLHQQRGDVSLTIGATTISGTVQCARVGPFRQDFDDDDGHPKRALGGIYRLFL